MKQRTGIKFPTSPLLWFLGYSMFSKSYRLGKIDQISSAPS
jgi:hypothetical protein